MKIEVSLRASNLKNAAGIARTSDSFAVVTCHNADDGRPEILGKTEVIDNTLSPEWVKTFIMDYNLGTPCKFVVSIVDQSSKKTMGATVIDAGECLGARGQTKAKKLKTGGTLFCHVSNYTSIGMLRLKLSGVELTNVEGFLKKSDPFYELQKSANCAGASSYDNVYRSKVIKDNLNPDWDTAIVDLGTLCNNDLDKPIKFAAFDHESSGEHDSMGMFETSVNGFVAACGGTIDLKNNGVTSGQIQVHKAMIAKFASTNEGEEADVEETLEEPEVNDTSAKSALPPSFLDYIAGGCSLNVVVAIDFTGSNGDPRQPGTLHHFSDTTLNPYEKAIKSILPVLAKYDTDCKFPVLGFGAKYDGVVQHCFQVGAEQESMGVKGVLKSYGSVFKSGLILSAPTCFTEIIDMTGTRAQASLEAAQELGQQSYTVLLIISDGSVSDVNATVESLRNVSDKPLSVVIVGVGDADFGAMEFLDDHAASGGGRDVAQFVQFNKHDDSPVALSSLTLKEIPDQLTGYFAMNDIQPNPAIVAAEEDIVVEAEDEIEIDLTLDIQEDEIVIGSGDFADNSRKWD